MLRFLILIPIVVLCSVYLHPVSYAKYMLLEKPILSSGIKDGCNSTRLMCQSNSYATGNLGRMLLYSTPANFDLDGGWGFTFKLDPADIDNYINLGVMLDGRACETSCSQHTDGMYYCTSTKSAMPSIKAACTMLGNDWSGQRCSFGGLRTKEKSTGVYHCINDNNGRTTATHPPICYDGKDIYICTLSQ
ncbi:protein ORF32 [Cyprinid herpesvirus 1]|uniref:Protein ORF32 n=1 Tax=Cyprinid herpesvirus 1 TaxID=317858 RepID=K7PBK8_9VIRU|nr:protein ORF32 [Cyprinid herpesvirus 1]AFJ20336.1 protein ORF32 [Cyprinid herpesvirus 1]